MKNKNLEKNITLLKNTLTDQKQIKYINNIELEIYIIENLISILINICIDCLGKDKFKILIKNSLNIIYGKMEEKP